MPRTARLKSTDSVYHIMSKSISEVKLFKDDDDKLEYISKIKKYQNLYRFRVYSYCLMDTHVHLIIDANGADISAIMKSINFTYAQYFNRKHNRHGHLFQDRFRSKIIDNDRYLMTCSAYIHNNPTDIIQYKNCPENYKFSSLCIYIKKNKDPFDLVEDGFIKSMFGPNSIISINNYLKFVYACNDREFRDNIEFVDEDTLYVSGRHILVREFDVKDIVEFVAIKMKLPVKFIYIKGSKKLVNAKALIVVLMRSLCNYNNLDICKVLGNITQSRVSMLSSLGINLICKNNSCFNIFEEFIRIYAIKNDDF